MDLESIKKFVDNGHKVFLGNENYQVKYDEANGYVIVCLSNGYMIGLTHKNGLTINADPSEFFVVRSSK